MIPTYKFRILAIPFLEIVTELRYVSALLNAAAYATCLAIRLDRLAWRFAMARYAESALIPLRPTVNISVRSYKVLKLREFGLQSEQKLNI